MSEVMNMPEHLTYAQVAEWLNCNVRTVRRMVERRAISQPLQNGAWVRFPRAAVVEFLNRAKGGGSVSGRSSTDGVES